MDASEAPADPEQPQLLITRSVSAVQCSSPHSVCCKNTGGWDAGPGATFSFCVAPSLAGKYRGSVQREMVEFNTHPSDTAGNQARGGLLSECETSRTCSQEFRDRQQSAEVRDGPTRGCLMPRAPPPATGLGVLASLRCRPTVEVRLP